MGPEVPAQALRSLHRFLTRGKASAQWAICRYLTISGPEHFVNIMIKIVDLLSTLMYV